MAAAWGGTFIAGRVVAPEVPHLLAAAGRFVVASACLLVLVRRVEGRLPRLDRGQLLGTALLGATGVLLYNLFFLGALGRMPASRTALLVALNPGTTALLAWAAFRERLGPVRWAGIALAFLGVVVVLSRGRPSSLFTGGVGAGEAMMMAGVLSWAVYTVLGRPILARLSPLATTTWASLWGASGLLLGAAVEHLLAPGWRPADLRPVHLLAIAYLGVVGTVMGFVWYYQGVQRLGPARAAVFTNLVPVFGVLLGVTLLAEPLHWSMVAGGLVALAGVTLVNLPGRA